MIKGVEVKNGNIRIFADVIEEILGCKCAALSGANIANEGEPITYIFELAWFSANSMSFPPTQWPKTNSRKQRLAIVQAISQQLNDSTKSSRRPTSAWEW